ncbi:MAG: hypothetical protein HYY86_03560 [Candidatus Harrisonbacteria bacterium]|nr:hypothetical protein [Candidatus Harrisonbacteria bacterium]
MKLRIVVLALSLFVPLSHSFADEPISVSSIPFQSVDYWDGLNSQVVFDSVKLHEKSWKLVVPMDKVEVVLLEEKNIYTTLNLVNAREDYGSPDWLKAEKAIVVVRQKSDFILWQNFLARIKKRQELERKKWLEPIRVLPPV